MVPERMFLGFPVEFLKVLGAGDAFCQWVFLYGILQGWEI